MKLEALALAALLAFAGCKPKQPNETPEGAVRELVEQLKALDGTERSAKAAFDLLSAETKKNLELRAERYSNASGKHIEPEMMLAPASFILRFNPRELQSEVRGGYAIVRARGLLPEESAEIRCVYENGGWRVDVALPALSPVVIRARDGEPPVQR
ncbi:MAG: hypothetical protein JNK04_10840 [Myxococcales bacterium]|nr:hypothetical protein [Myxococcales bacterium]